MKTATYWHSDPQGRAQCDLCPHRCIVVEGGQGRCRTRGVRNGKLVALGYGAVSSLQVDPIEKKPLYHFFPGCPIFSVGGWGCNLSCSFCQNWTISQQAVPPGRTYAPEAIVDGAGDSIGIAYTYNEPLVAYEFVYDTASLARERGLKNVLVTNGHINPDPAAELLPLIDALNIDIKSMDPAFYMDHCGGDQAAVLSFAAQAHAAGCHVELTNLVIPSLNDTEDNFRSLANWVSNSLSSEVPLHLSAYRPCYELDIPSTPLQTLERAWEICSDQLDYVYLGNVMSEQGCDTHCPVCDAELIRRSGFRARVTGITDGRCASCGRVADVVSS
ncbi:MAG: AmmeMemoRadiSam system radical SAM enzyme [Kiritimatiellae bacterium]|nr:AmmeMemoRadiSam system radical SAM enzyme [Kiritimatiellia bacterium]